MQALFPTPPSCHLERSEKAVNRYGHRCAIGQILRFAQDDNIPFFVMLSGAKHLYTATGIRCAVGQILRFAQDDRAEDRTKKSPTRVPEQPPSWHVERSETSVHRNE